ncbi:MAG: YiiX/YebB-like N1pC/P60 family cysteine hydrolase [Candidatus Omnitrophica bacterium]|nr:YiiX/YebB-like N1pC/P60 family cysteine hydrolase [Candidatus Omnitrophota bacterium]
MKQKTLLLVIDIALLFLLVKGMSVFSFFFLLILWWFVFFQAIFILLDILLALYFKNKEKHTNVNKEKLKNGDILLCKGYDIVSCLIKRNTGSIYSHVAVIASAELGLVVEAIPTGGVRAISIDNYKTSYDVYRVKEEYVFDVSGVVSYLVRMLARGYDFISVTRLGFKMLRRRSKLAKLLGLKLLHKKSSADTLQEGEDYFCSELCYKAFFFGGKLDIVPEVADGETTSPGDISRSLIVEKVT